jgi:transcriptional regulator with XRE-family HTH domain
MLESAQIRAARGLLGWRQQDLSKASGVGTATIRRIEKSERAMTSYVSTIVRIQAAFEDAGIQFIDEDENGGYGLRLKKKKRKR